MKRRGSNPVTGSVAAVVAAVIAVTFPASLACGQEQAATAEALFREARELSAHGDYAGACPKFAASQRLDPGYGTLYNLGECLAHQGKTASAWAAFQEAASLAKTAGQTEREAKATRAAGALEANLERMIIVIKAPPPGLMVKRGGVVIDAAAWGSPLPVDPGKHLLEASAPGKVPFSLEVASGGPGKAITVEIPPLADVPVPAPAAPAAPPATPASSDGAPSRRIAAYLTGGAGVVGVVVGAIMGSSAKSKWNEAETQDCKTSTLCNQTGVDLVSSAKTAATVSDVGFIAGGALVATSVILLVTALPTRPRTTGRLMLSPAVDPKRGELLLRGSF
jgi:hypothetical protein